MKPISTPTAGLACAVLLGLAACGGGAESSSGSLSSSSGNKASPSSASCNYADLVSSGERSNANACGIQASGNFAQADSMLASVIAACQQGEKAKADAYYAGTYKQAVGYARDVSTALSCGASNGPALPNTSTQTYYNFCVTPKTVNGKLSYAGACWGPVKQNEGGCGGETNLIAQYKDRSTCMSQGQAWINAH